MSAWVGVGAWFGFLGCIAFLAVRDSWRQWDAKRRAARAKAAAKRKLDLQVRDVAVRDAAAACRAAEWCGLMADQVVEIRALPTIEPKRTLR